MKDNKEMDVAKEGKKFEAQIKKTLHGEDKYEKMASAKNHNEKSSTTRSEVAMV